MLQLQGLYSEAESTFRKVLDSYREQLGERHASTLTAVTNLATSLRDQGKHHEAVEFYEQAIEVRTEV